MGGFALPTAGQGGGGNPAAYQQLMQSLFGQAPTPGPMQPGGGPAGAQPIFGGPSIPPAIGPGAPTPTPPAGSGVSTSVSPAMYPTQMTPPPSNARNGRGI